MLQWGWEELLSKGRELDSQECAWGRKQCEDKIRLGLRGGPTLQLTSWPHGSLGLLGPMGL